MILSDSNTSGDYTDDYDDLSKIDYPRKFYISPWEILFKSLLYAAIILTSLVGNSLVIAIVCRNKRMQTTTNYYIVNLAVSDLLVTCSCTWVHLVENLTNGWVLGAFFCKFNSFAQVLSLVSSVLTLTLIACDRFFGIVFAMKAHVTERRAKLFVAGVWACAVVTSSPLLFVRLEERREWRDHVEIWCDEEWPSPAHTSRAFYFTFVSVVLYFLPVLVMSVAYGFIIAKLWSSQAPGEQIQAEVMAKNRMKKKVVVMLVFILLVFAVCWLPLQISILYYEYKLQLHSTTPDWYNKFSFFAHFLAYASSAFNPVIYTGFNENFRRGFKTLFKCRKRRKNSLYTSIAQNQSRYDTSNYGHSRYGNPGNYEKGDSISLSNTIVTRIS